MSNNPTESICRPYTKKELADRYGISIKTLKTWLRPHLQHISEPPGRYYTVRQVRLIFEYLGEP
jgi:hypothetical protein